ncbi:MAG: polysaccharide biosynthesis/export family protein [Deltaproteobacteria bacterium]|nr:polysaccharide biosynthesis/export family protein [Deltaproteobacteria bacterium]
MRKISFLFYSLGLCLFLTANPLAAAPGEPGAPVQDYRIQVGDALDIKLFYHPELNESVIVRPDGRISLQLVHEVQAAGLTPEQLRQHLRDQYAAQISQPEIAVIVRSFTAQKVYVDGEVTKPGLVPLTGAMTLLQSLSSAGGMKDTARTGEVIVIRRGPENRPASMVVNVEKAIDGSDPSQDLALQPADIVYVPKSVIANINIWVDQYIRKNIPIPFGFSYNLAPY